MSNGRVALFKNAGISIRLLYRYRPRCAVQPDLDVFDQDQGRSGLAEVVWLKLGL